MLVWPTEKVNQKRATIVKNESRALYISMFTVIANLVAEIISFCQVQVLIQCLLFLSFRIWAVSVRWRPQERHLAGRRPDAGLLHAEKWGKALIFCLSILQAPVKCSVTCLCTLVLFCDGSLHIYLCWKMRRGLNSALGYFYSLWACVREVKGSP